MLLYPHHCGFERANENIIPLCKERQMSTVAIKRLRAGGVLKNALEPSPDKWRSRAEA